MVSVIIEQKRDRAVRIGHIKQALALNPNADIKELVFQIASSYGCSVRKAREYIQVAKWEIENGKSAGD